MKANLTALAAKLQVGSWRGLGVVEMRPRALSASPQPHVVAFGGQDIVASPARWVGTEAGYAVRKEEAGDIR